MLLVYWLLLLFKYILQLFNVFFADCFLQTTQLLDSRCPAKVQLAGCHALQGETGQHVPTVYEDLWNTGTYILTTNSNPLIDI